MPASSSFASIWVKAKVKNTQNTLMVDFLVPVREVYERAKRLAMSLTIANRIRATDVLARFSRLRARRRQRVSQASVLSTIQRFGSTTKPRAACARRTTQDRKSTRLNSSHANISYAVF